jgi:hypothetical protein
MIPKNQEFIQPINSPTHTELLCFPQYYAKYIADIPSPPELQSGQSSYKTVKKNIRNKKKNDKKTVYQKTTLFLQNTTIPWQCKNKADYKLCEAFQLLPIQEGWRNIKQVSQFENKSGTAPVTATIQSISPVSHTTNPHTKIERRRR